MNSLKSLQDDALDALSSLLSPGTQVALLDFPRHQNAGDSFIWLGTLAYLERLEVSVDYVADIHCFDAGDLRQRVPNGPILITGGGNFGDRWVEHQDFREKIASLFPDRQIIQLPQSLDFQTVEGLEKAQEVLNSHPDLTIMLRQTVDIERASRWFTSSRHVFCPDLALGLGRMARRGAPTCDAVLLLRNDSEAVLDRSLESFTGLACEVTDWSLGSRGQWMWKLYRMPENVARVLTWTRPFLLTAIQWSYVRAAQLNLSGAERTLSRGRILVTDRLHGMFLGALMGIPTIALDNANGKVSGIFNDYLKELPNVYMAESLDDAAYKTKSLLGLLH